MTSGSNRRGAIAAALLGVLTCVAAPLRGQRGGMFLGSIDDPAIAYRTASLDNAVVDANAKLLDGRARLSFDGRAGYLRSALALLDIPVESQMLVFSQTSFQRRRIGATNPRALFFNDRVALGWVRDGDLIEVAAHDANEGVVFYTLEQRPAERPEFRRAFTCLACHLNGDTLGVPGLLMFSTTAPADGGPAKSIMTDQRTPIAERWGGWYVTGAPDSITHRGRNATTIASPAPMLESTGGLFDADAYVSTASDVAALLVLSHQAHMTNLLTRASWEARAADPLLHAPFVEAPGERDRVAHMMGGVAREVVDYLLFVDEAPLPAPIPASPFTRHFGASGPRDRRGRSLHDLDLVRRLMRYPCSYMVYSRAFAALPPAAKTAIYERLWAVLWGRDADPRYARALTPDARRSVLDILADTMDDLPSYWSRP